MPGDFIREQAWPGSRIRGRRVSPWPSGGRLWGRASRLPVSLEQERTACPRDRGALRSHERDRYRSGAWIPRHRPSGPPKAAQRRPIGGVAQLVASKAATPPMGRRQPPSAPGKKTATRLPGEPPLDVFRGSRDRRVVSERKTSGTARPRDAPFPQTRSGFGLASNTDSDCGRWSLMLVSVANPVCCLCDLPLYRPVGSGSVL